MGDDRAVELRGVATAAKPAIDRLSGVTGPWFQLCPVRLVRSLRRFEAAFPGAHIHYAMKANSERAVLEVLVAEGASFEVASLGEWHELLDACPSIASGQVLFGTSVKPAAAITALAEAGVDLMAADSPEELRRIAAAAPGCRVVLRVVVGHGDSVFTMYDKFGAPVGDVPALVALALALRLVPYGLSFNVGSQARSDDAWADAINHLEPVVRQVLGTGTRFEVLNLGGGYPHQYAREQVGTLESIAAQATAALENWPYRPRLILEPGRAIVAPAIDLYTSVVSRVRRGDRDWLYLDAGVYNALFEALACQGTTRYETRLAERASSAASRHFVLAGPTGDGLDVIDEHATLPSDVQEGDLIRIVAVGAYSSVVASGFNGFDVVRTRSHGRSESCALCADDELLEVPDQRSDIAS